MKPPSSVKLLFIENFNEGRSWGKWSAWSACRTGIKRRFRHCIGRCTGKRHEKANCRGHGRPGGHGWPGPDMMQSSEPGSAGSLLLKFPVIVRF